MNLEAGDLYHIYNQGNNRVRIFYSRENYFFFLKKIRTHIIPHADILAWCLMPNHFHLMAYVHTLEIEITEKEEEAHSEVSLEVKPSLKTHSPRLLRCAILITQSGFCFVRIHVLLMNRKIRRVHFSANPHIQNV